MLKLRKVMFCACVFMLFSDSRQQNFDEQASLPNKSLPIKTLLKLRDSTIPRGSARSENHERQSLIDTSSQNFPIITAPGISEQAALAFLEVANNITRSIDVALQKIEDSIFI